ncbi:histone-lysine N-methyltransferase SETMAR [Trichonephila clavipes]|nr:histone-lysine N-methyltransferase SETMAR [Trichonephila clavipes]
MELTRKHYRAMFLYGIKAGLNTEECFQRLQLAFGDESPCRAPVFKWSMEFCRGRNSFQDEEHTVRSQSAVIPFNVSAIRKMLMENNRCTYQMIQKKLKIGYTAIHKIIHSKLFTYKKEVCRWVPHNLTEHQKEERVRISKETLKLLNDGGHHIISKILTGDETYVPFF